MALTAPCRAAYRVSHGGAEYQWNHPVSGPSATAGLHVFLSGLLTQRRVIRAILLREMQVRFGRDNLGILWIILEPMMFASTVTAIHAFAGEGLGGRQDQVYPFTVIGYCLFIIFRGIFNRSEGAISGSAPLLHHRMITPFDIMLARALVDAVGCISALILLMLIGVMFGLAELPARPLYLISAAFLIFWMSLGLALIVAAYTYEGHFVGRLVHPFSYAMLPLSGAFVTMAFLPTWARDLMAWNPMMTVFEMARYGQFQDAPDDYVYPGFAIGVCAMLTYWGLVALQNLRNRIHVS